MSVKPIVEIEIKDGNYQKFAAQFKEFQESLAKTPRTWEQATKAMDGSVESYKELVELAKSRLLQTRLIGEAEKEAADAIDRPAKERADQLKRQTEEVKRQQAAWASMAKSAESMASGVAKATISLVRWAGLTGVISGLLGAGGLYGIDRLAISAGNARRSGLGLGVTPGEQSAFGANFGRVVSSDAVLNGVNEALTDPRKSVPFYALGLNYQAEQQKGTYGASVDVLAAIKKLADATPTNRAGTTYEARRLSDLGISLEDFLRIKNTPANELAQYAEKANLDKRTLDLTREQQRAWQDLQVTLNVAGRTLEKDLIVGLTTLTGPISKLSGTFTNLINHLLEKDGPLSKFIDEFADGLAALDKKIGDPEFVKNVENFVIGVGAMAKAALNVAAVFGKVLGNQTATSEVAGAGAGAFIGAGVGSVVPVVGTGLGAAIGGAAGFVGGGLISQSFKNNVKTKKLAGEAYDYFVAQGWSPAQASGIIANIYAESSFNPNAGAPSAAQQKYGVQEGHFGLGQWDAKRRADFEKLYHHRIESASFQEQLAFYQWELTHTEKSAGDKLRSIGNTPGAAAAVVNENFERSGTNSAYRANVAGQFADQFKDRSVTVNVNNTTGGNANVSVAQTSAGQ